jgi:O-antigen ligase
MIIHPQWRNAGGWLTVALLLSCMVLTETRTNLIIVGVIALLYPALARGQGIGRLLVLAAIIVGASTWGLEHVPGMQKMQSRFSQESLTGEGSSLQGRLEIYQYGFNEVLRTPWGLGLGSSGMGQRTAGTDIQTLGDAGYVQIFAQFGWIGGILFFTGLLRLWSELGRRWTFGRTYFGPEGVDPFIPATRAVLVGSMVFLFVGEVFAGFSLLWVFLGRSLNPITNPEEQAEVIPAVGAEVGTGADCHAATTPD